MIGAVCTAPVARACTSQPYKDTTSERFAASVLTERTLRRAVRHLYQRLYMATRPPSPEVALRRQQVAHLYFQGNLQAQMAAELGVTQAAISLDLKALRIEWVQAALMDFNAAKARELAHIDPVEVEYWQGWQRSQQPRRKTTREIITRAAPTRPGADESATEDNPTEPVPYRRVTVVE